MSRKLSLSPALGSRRIWRRTIVSGVVLASYLAYALHERLAMPAQDIATPSPTPEPAQGALPAQQEPTATPVEQDTAVPTATPEGTSSQSAAVSSPDSAVLSPTPQPSQTASAPVQALPVPTRPPKNTAVPTAMSPVTSGSLYKNGTFTGATANAFYGQVQVQVVISQGKISSVTFLNYPKDRRTSARINSFAVPQLQFEAIRAQSARVNIVSGATLTSEAFMASLQSALNIARG